MVNIKKLSQIAKELRLTSLVMAYLAQSGHLGGSLSALDLITVLYFSIMKHRPKSPKWSQRDRFILSKGHSCLGLYAALAKLGYFPIKELWRLRQVNALLQGHPYSKIPGIEATTGSLGQGLSYGAGIALSLKMKKSKSRVYVLMGDGEIQEGQIWEAANFAAQNKLDNLCGIVDWNGWQLDCQTKTISNPKLMVKKWQAFGWQTIEINGHNFQQIIKAFKRAKKIKGKPTVIIAKTIKGKGSKLIESNPIKFHGVTPNSQEFIEIIEEILDQKEIKELKKSILGRMILSQIVKIKKKIGREESLSPKIKKLTNPKDLLKNQATRIGFGQALWELARINPKIIGLTADLMKSVKMDKFAQEFPEKFFQCGIAEANMVSAASGLAKENFIPFPSTFAVFMTGRALDQIRIICYSQDNVKFVASHSGISVGQDGVTHQMAEDLAHMRVIPNMTIIVPADAYEARKATLAAAQHKGPIYLRFGRSSTPTVTEWSEKFKIGQAKILRQGKDAAIIACGIMVSRALEAAKILQRRGIKVMVVNMHTIKPIDEKVIIKAAKTGAIITAEEHSIIGGLGGVVAEVLIKNKPVPMEMIGINDCFAESGKAEDLLKKYGLTAQNIVKAVKKVIRKK